MSAEIVRRAAALMRERAEGSRMWYPSEHHDGMDEAPWMDREWWSSVGLSDLAADHIASWHPTVALAVADWLDHVADRAEKAPKRNYLVRDALAVARAYLGEQVP